MSNSDRFQTWFSVIANLAILVGIALVGFELNQNTEHLRLQLLDQINGRLYEDNRALLGANPATAIEKSIVEPENMTFAEFKVVDAYLMNGLSGWEDRFFLYQAGLVDADDWKRKIDEEADWYFGNRFAKRWWREAGIPVVEEEFAQYIDEAIAGVGNDDTYGFWQRSRVAPLSDEKVAP